MSIKNWNAGIIRPVPVAPAGPFQDGAAPGVWTLDQVAYWTQQGLWPIAGSGATPYGIVGGGSGGITTTNRFIINSTGNASTFNSLGVAGEAYSAFASSTRAIFGCPNNSKTTIQYSTFASGGSFVSFGNATEGLGYRAGLSNSTRGLFCGGSTPTSTSINYVTIASTGDTTSFGALTEARRQLSACASTTRGIIAGGDEDSAGTKYNTIDYVTIATTGNATDFGDLTDARNNLAAVSSSTRAVFAGGANGPKNIIDYVTIATTGNATDFGDLLISVQAQAGCSSSVRGVFCGGAPSTNVMQYITIASTGDATDFGDLTFATFYIGGCSNVHGGL